MLKIIYVGCNYSFWPDVAINLSNIVDWQPIYWIGRSELKPRVVAEFPEVIYHPVIDAIRGINPLEIPPVILDQPFLRSFANTKIDTLKMMDRMSVLGSFDYAARDRLYHQGLMYWRAVIERYQPDLVVFGTIPHLVYDYLIYAVCRWTGIRTVMFESTPMRGLVFMEQRFDEQSQAERLYQDLMADGLPDEIPLQPETEAYLNALRGSYDHVPKYMRRVYKEEVPGRQPMGLSTALRKLVDFSDYGRFIHKQRLILKQKLSPPRSYQVKRGQTPEQSNITWLDDRLIRWQAKHYIRKLDALYHHLAEEPDFNRPYIYVGLSFQPERTSSPMAGIYVNQNLMINMIASLIPSGWQVYVKDHPAQFLPSTHFRAQSGRTPFFYKDLAALPNVRLVPMATSSFDLTDHSRAIATVTGTVGWEALNRGKPVLLFGYSWYRGCEGTFQIDSQEECAIALHQIESGCQVDPKKLRLFAHAMERVGIEGYVEPHLRVTEISEAENADRLSKALIKFWETADEVSV